MIDTNTPATIPAPSAKLLRACELASEQLGPLTDFVEALARSRPEAPVPADLLVLARRALYAVAPVAKSLGAPALLPLHPPVTRAGLAARLALAAQQAKTFRRRHFAPGTALEAIAWHMENRTLALAASGNRSRGADPDDPWAAFR